MCTGWLFARKNDREKIGEKGKKECHGVVIWSFAGRKYDRLNFSSLKDNRLTRTRDLSLSLRAQD